MNPDGRRRSEGLNNTALLVPSMTAMRLISITLRQSPPPTPALLMQISGRPKSFWWRANAAASSSESNATSTRFPILYHLPLLMYFVTDKFSTKLVHTRPIAADSEVLELMQLKVDLVTSQRRKIAEAEVGL